MISIIIPSRNRHELLARVLDHLCRTAPPAEIIVVDDASEPPICIRQAEARVVRLPRRSGHGAARNAGASAATGDVLVFMDDDICPAPSAWEYLLSHLEAAIPTWVGPAIADSLPDTTPTLAPLEAAPHLPAAVLVTRAVDFATVGGFDETLPRLVDFDLTFRARRMGHRLIKDHRAVAAHLDVIHTFPQKIQRMHDWMELFPRVWAGQGCPEEMMTDVGHDFFCPNLAPPSAILRMIARLLQADWTWKVFRDSLPRREPSPLISRRLYAIAAARAALRGLHALTPNQRQQLLLECRRAEERRRLAPVTKDPRDGHAPLTPRT